MTKAQKYHLDTNRPTGFIPSVRNGNTMHLSNSGDDIGEGHEEARPLVALDDVKLARRAMKDPMAAEQLIARLAPKIRHMVYMAVGNDQEANDLAQLCLVEVLENLGKFKGTGVIDAWAGRLTYRVLMRQLSRRRRKERTEPLVEVDGSTGEHSNPENETRRGRLRNQLMKHLHKLPQERQMTLVLRLAYQYSVPEVAEIMDVPINTVRDRIRVGLKEMRQSMLRDPEAKEFLKGLGHE